jgi:hypothetical protein
MANAANSSSNMLKSVLLFSVLILGAAAFFVGSEESEGVLSSTASSNSDAGLAPKGPVGPSNGPLAGQPARELAGQPSDEFDESEVVEWSDEAFIDNAEGLDPTPADDDGFNPGPIDDSGGVDADSNSVTPDGLPELPSDAAEPMAGAPVPIG